MNRLNKKHFFTKKDFLGWCVLLPGVILFAFFVWIPMLTSIKLAFYSTKGFHLIEFVGFENFIRVFKHPDFLAALRNTFVYCAWSLILGFFTPIIVAILISDTVIAKDFFKGAVYFPAMVPGLASALIAGFFFLGSKSGVMNILLSKVGLQPQVWLSHSAWTIPIIILLCTWHGTGGTSLIYMARIGGVSSDLYDAASIDGAGYWRRLRHIVIPEIMPLAKELLILQVISVFQIMYEPLIVTNGGPNNASLSLMQLVYRYAFERFDYSSACALSVVICGILVLLSVIYNSIDRATKE